MPPQVSSVSECLGSMFNFLSLSAREDETKFTCKVICLDPCWLSNKLPPRGSFRVTGSQTSREMKLVSFSFSATKEKYVSTVTLVCD